MSPPFRDLLAFTYPFWKICSNLSNTLKDLFRKDSQSIVATYFISGKDVKIKFKP